jgi:tetratricopeptide (TPR) repeat protein
MFHRWSTTNTCYKCHKKFKKQHTCRARSHRRSAAGTDNLPDRASAEKRILGANGEIRPQYPNVNIMNIGLHFTRQLNKLAVDEALLRDITIYFKKVFKSVKVDDQGTLFTSNGAKLCNDHCTKFDSYCFTATILAEQKRYEEAFDALEKACVLVEEIIRAEHPRTLPCFFEVLIHLTRNGLHPIVQVLCRHISAMSAKLFQSENPWRWLLQRLCELDDCDFDKVIARAWECITDVFNNKLSPENSLAVSIRLDYIKRIYGMTDYNKEEYLLRKLLEALQKEGPFKITIPRVMLNLAHNMGRQGRYIEAEDLAQRVLQLLQQATYAEIDLKWIECLKILSHNQFKRGCFAPAEDNMRRAIAMIKGKWGLDHSWVAEFKLVLEGWLKSQGKVEAANNLWMETEKPTGQVESDE